MLDFQEIVIILIFALLYLLEQYDIYSKKKKESFQNSPEYGYSAMSPNLQPGYLDWNPSVNIGNSSNFGNFGTIGSYPPNPLCNSCHMVTDQVQPPYLHANDVGDESDKGKVSMTCRSQNGKNYGDLSHPLLVSARSIGRTRQCRRLV